MASLSPLRGESPLLGETKCSGISDTIRHRQVPVSFPTTSEDVPSITGRGLADEDADVPPIDAIKEIAPWQFPMRVLATSRDSGLEGVSPELVDIGGP